jgi:hypothetical protein
MDRRWSTGATLWATSRSTTMLAIGGGENPGRRRLARRWRDLPRHGQPVELSVIIELGHRGFAEVAAADHQSSFCSINKLPASRSGAVASGRPAACCGAATVWHQIALASDRRGELVERDRHP